MSELAYDVRAQRRTWTETALSVVLLPVALVILAGMAIREYL
ncbi:hypothetical protein AEAC466_11460 [Asticcacaulis sp. AC466]|nr:hypothetical protein [Asticcacaulis sp. AC466]ESQ83939.1 hypothetical protein AEAC466_11460 [Asticcacaulis sp. AC466]